MSWCALYTKICISMNMQKYAKRNMQIYALAPWVYLNCMYMPKYAKNMQKICKIWKHENYMHNMHLPLCWWPMLATKMGRATGQGRSTDLVFFHWHILHFLHFVLVCTHCILYTRAYLASADWVAVLTPARLYALVVRDEAVPAVA